jgi:hypothetical protein
MLKVVNEKKLSCVAQRIAEGMSAIVTQSGCQELLTAFRFVILHLAPRASGLPSVDGRQTLMIAEIGLAEKGLPKKAYFFHPPTTPLSFSWPGFPKLFYFCPKKRALLYTRHFCSAHDTFFFPLRTRQSQLLRTRHFAASSA